MLFAVRLPLTLLAGCLSAAGLLVACGGGSSSTPTTTVTGSVVKGPVNGATVCAYKATSAGKGDPIKCVTSGSTGSYTMDLEHAGDVVIEATGGSYTDEATGVTKTLSDPLQVVLNTQGGAASGMVTPLTTVAYSIAKNMAGGVSSGNFASAATSVASQFQLGTVNITATTPVVSGGANAYGQVLRAVSQFVANGNSLGALLSFGSPDTLQTALSSAFETINGVPANFSFSSGGAAAVPTTPTTPSAPTTPAAPASPSAQSCGITVSGSGTVTTQGLTLPFSLPATRICVANVPAASCTAGNAGLQSIAAAAATTGGNYTLNYSYSYTPGDCAGAIATVAYQ
ncbi:MAG: hypothetical protein Q7T63_00600 [Burkholderiaceae bacterium]|nr:hypothetical protein [Burkholderiaceae bacterium]MDO9088930.1 hypothetical protein [Burkholderiaceae bacterium]